MDRAQRIATAFLGLWSQHHAAHDHQNLASLYTADALFFGSTPELRQGPDAIRSYFEQVPRQNEPHVDFSLLAAEVLAPDVVSAASIGTFTWRGHAGTRVRFTHVLTDRIGAWRASVHHATIL